MANLKVIPIVGLLLLAGCDVLGLNESAVEGRVDETIDRLIGRMCKGPIDVAVRTAERHPALFRAAFDTCPETYGRLRDIILAEFVRRGLDD